VKWSEIDTKIKIAIAAAVAFMMSFCIWKLRHGQARRNQQTPNIEALESEVARLGLTVAPDGILRQLSDSAPRELEWRSSEAMQATFNGVRLVNALAVPEVTVVHARFRLKGSLAALVDEWRSIASTLKVPVHVASAELEFEDRLLSRVKLRGVSLSAIESGYRVIAQELTLGSKHWNDLMFTIEKPKSAVLMHWGGMEPGSRPIELRFISTPGVATEWILEIPSQPLGSIAMRGIKTLPCTRATGTLSIVVPDNPQLKMRGRFQSVADDCQGPNWLESSALFGGSVAVAFGVEPEDDHRSWSLRSVEFTSAMFELKGKGKLLLDGEPELSWDVSGSRTCAQLEAHLPPSRYLDQVKSFMITARSGALARAAEKAAVTLNMRGKVSGSSALERTVSWHMSGNCGIKNEDDPK